MIACIYEGSAEKAILDLLMENQCLSFTQDDLLSGDFIRRISGKAFASRYLGYSLKEKSIEIIRVQDSRNAKLGLPSAFNRAISREIRCLTHPEIEILIILAENKFEDYCKKKQKPSEYCKSSLKLPDVKNYDFVYSYFSEIDKLLYSIKKYDEYAQKDGKDEISLYDILSDEVKRQRDS